MGDRLDSAIAVLNGVVGDYLSQTGNGLATSSAFMHAGAPLTLERSALQAAHASPSPKLCVLAHGLACNESIWRMPDGSDYGTRLRDELGYTPFYLRYNSGRPIADSGADLAKLLEALLLAYPIAVESIVLIGYSMGGLVVRSACHAASQGQSAWLPKVRASLYVGTPHRGAPMERVGRVLQHLLHAVPDPYTKLIGDIASLRSAGIQDLGDADLRHEDRAARRISVSLRDPQHPVPMLDSMRHYLIAGSYIDEPWLSDLLGDMVVPLQSASNASNERVRVFRGLTHLDVAHDAGVYAQLKAWCQEVEHEE